MKTRSSGKRFLITMVAFLLAVPAFGHDQKKHPDRAMIEKMEAVPCGAKEHGMTGLGSVWASVGVTSVNSEEKLCPQYLLRSDDMEYHVRPLDRKHPVILPIGKEAEFKVAKDKFDMRIPDGDRKTRHYQVVAMKPIDHTDTSASEGSRYDVPRKDYADNPLAGQNVGKAPVQSNDRPLQSNDHPQ
jgi:hypothetical protein